MLVFSVRHTTHPRSYYFSNEQHAWRSRCAQLYTDGMLFYGCDFRTARPLPRSAFIIFIFKLGNAIMARIEICIAYNSFYSFCLAPELVHGCMYTGGGGRRALTAGWSRIQTQSTQKTLLSSPTLASSRPEQPSGRAQHFGWASAR